MALDKLPGSVSRSLPINFELHKIPVYTHTGKQGGQALMRLSVNTSDNGLQFMIIAQYDSNFIWSEYVWSRQSQKCFITSQLRSQIKTNIFFTNLSYTMSVPLLPCTIQWLAGRTSIIMHKWLYCPYQHFYCPYQYLYCPYQHYKWFQLSPTCLPMILLPKIAPIHLLSKDHCMIKDVTA